MERLSFNSKFAYSATEAAIHMARYQLAAPFCRGARVLDVACGEGYGALAMKRLGAASVEAVDSSVEAINTARKLFKTAGVNHQVADATRIDELFPGGEFDLVVSLETIEHIADPERFLVALRKVAKPDAVIIISCPNDTWYYPANDQSNPFHVRKYSFEQFRDLTIKVLGSNVVWGYGVPMIGFGNVTDDEIAARDPMIGQAVMLDFTVQASAITLPQRQFSDVGPRNCSYFVGQWGGTSEGMHSAAVVPVSMDQYSNLVSWESAGQSPRRLTELEGQLAALQGQLAEVNAQVASCRGERDTLAGNLAALGEEKATLDTRIARLTVEVAHEQSKTIAQALEIERHQATLERQQSSLASLEASSAAAVQEQVRAMSEQLDEQKQQAELYRIQAFALAREAETAAAQARKLNDEKLALQLQVDALPQEIERRSAEAMDQVRADAERYRIQAFALAKEVEVLTRRTAELSAGVVTGGLRVAIARSGKYRIRSFAASIKPMLPEPVIGAARHVARKLNL